MSVFSGTPDIITLVCVIIIVIAVCIGVIFSLRKIRDRNWKKIQILAGVPLHAPFRVQKIPAGPAVISPDTGSAMTAADLPDPGIDCTRGMTDLSQSLGALAKKYSLATVTLATSDGLLLASSNKGISDDDVAHYCRDYVHEPTREHPGVLLFGTDHKGSLIIGIAATLSPLSPGVKQSLVRETKDILNWWI